MNSRPLTSADAAVAEVEQEFGRALEGAAVVHVDPGIGQRSAPGGAAVDDEGQADLVQQRDAAGRSSAGRAR